MSYTSDVIITWFAFIVGAFLLCMVVAGVLITVFVYAYPRTKRFWLWVDQFYYSSCMAGLLVVALNLGSLYVDSMAHGIEAFIEQRFGQAQSGARSGILHTTAGVTQSAAADLADRQRAEAELAWFRAAASAMEQGAKADSWKHFLEERGIALDSHDCAALPNVERNVMFTTKQLIVCDLRVIYSNQKELARIKQFPTLLREFSWYWWVTVVGGMLYPIGLATRFAKVAAELQGFKPDTAQGAQP